MKVFVVATSGYEHYTIHGIFTTQKLANKLLRSGTLESSYDNNPQVDVFELDKLTPRVAQGYKAFTVTMSKDGNIEEVKFGTCWLYDDEDYDPTPEFCSVNEPPFICSEKVQYALWAKNEAQALKLAQELHQKHVKSGEWKEVFDWISERIKEGE